MAQLYGTDPGCLLDPLPVDRLPVDHRLPVECGCLLDRLVDRLPVDHRLLVECGCLSPTGCLLERLPVDRLSVDPRLPVEMVAC